MTAFERTQNYTPGGFAPDAYRSEPEAGDSHEPATLDQAWAALEREGPRADAVQSYLSPGPQPRYDSPQARAEAQADMEAGS